VFIDGHAVGTTCNRYLLVENLRAGRHRVEAKARDDRYAHQLVERELAPGDVQLCEMTLQPGKGFLRILSDVGVLTVQVDEKPYRVPARIEVEAGYRLLIVGDERALYRVEVLPNQTVDVRVTQEWSTREVPPGALVVAPDGRGEFRELEQALHQAPPGAYVCVRAGLHRLSRPLRLDRPLSIIGAGEDATFLVGERGPAILTFSGDDTLLLSYLTLRREGEEAGDVARCDQGKIVLRRCRVEGAKAKEGPLGFGLRIYGRGRGEVEHCTFQRNELVGLGVDGQGAFTVEQSVFTANGFGIVLRGVAAGAARNNTCSGNERSGVIVADEAKPRLEGNTCEGNKGSGIAYFGSSTGVACNNTCSDNVASGIYVDERAQPTLEGNTCQGNKESGICYFGSAGGVARDNTCSSNESVGIIVADEAKPRLEGNTCQGTGVCGIAYVGSSAGVACNNSCSCNERYGIYVGKQAQPTLEGNTCQGNNWSGIGYFGSAAGVARNNTCSGNERSGIIVADEAKPRLEGNTCEGNKGSGIAYFGSSTGVACDNTCSGNELFGIYVEDDAKPMLQGNTCHGNKRDDIFSFR
jgi:parallel beta-helix repeat protein